MHRSLIIRVALCYVSFIVGTMAEYQQSLMLFLVFTVINGITGGVILFSHCMANEVVRLQQIYKYIYVYMNINLYSNYIILIITFLFLL